MLGAEVRWRRLALRFLVDVTRASWQIVLDSRIAQTECTHLPELLVHRAKQSASMDVCDKKRGRCGAIMNYFLSAVAIAHKKAKGKTKGRKKEMTTISQRAAQIVEGACTKESKDVACPRCDPELHIFNAASGPILRCRGWNLAGTPCTLIKACHDGAVVPGRLRSTNRTGGGNSASGSGGPGTLPRRDDGTQDPPPINDWTAQVQYLEAKPALGTGWVKEGSLVQLNAAVYGLVNAPSAWRKTIVRGIKSLGYRRSCYDPYISCLMDESRPQGHILIEVEDLATHGNAVHGENMAKPQKTFKFGKWKSIYISVTTSVELSFRINLTVSMSIRPRLFKRDCVYPIVIPRGRSTDKKSETSDGQKSNERSVLMCQHLHHLAWDHSITVPCKTREDPLSSPSMDP